MGRETSRLSLDSIRLVPHTFPARAAGEDEYYERTADKPKLLYSDLVTLRYQPRPRGSSGSRPLTNASNSRLPR